MAQVSQTDRPDIPALHAMLGTLLEAIADAGLSCLLDPSVATWDIGRGPSSDVALAGAHVGSFPVADLPRLVALVDGVTTVGATLTHTTGRRAESRTVTGEWAGITVEISVWVPAPTEREQLIARLAELDAAEGGAA